jgi:hypothetical protein
MGRAVEGSGILVSEDAWPEEGGANSEMPRSPNLRAIDSSDVLPAHKNSLAAAVSAAMDSQYVTPWESGTGGTGSARNSMIGRGPNAKGIVKPVSVAVAVTIWS